MDIIGFDYVSVFIQWYNTVMDETRIAWAAGFFDGEGYIELKNGKCARIEWSQKDLAPLIQLNLIFNTGVIGQQNRDTRFLIYTYRVFGREAIRVLRRMLPYLTVKRAKAIEAIETECLIRPKKPNRI